VVSVLSGALYFSYALNMFCTLSFDNDEIALEISVAVHILIINCADLGSVIIILYIF